MKQDIMEFHTMGDYIAYISVTPRHASNVGVNERSEKINRDRLQFTGTNSFQEASKLALEGWQDGLANLTSKLDLCLAKGKSRYRINDAAGDYPDIGRFLGGMPNSMSRRVINDGLKRPIIDLLFNATYSTFVKTDSIMNYGAAVASVVDELETLGFRVSLKAGVCSNGWGTNRKIGAIVTIKTPQEALELDKAVFALAHASFQRRLFFKYKEINSTAEELGTGYGQCTDLPHSDAIYFPQHDCDYRTVERARDYVKGIIRGSRPDLFDDVQEAA